MEKESASAESAGRAGDAAPPSSPLLASLSPTAEQRPDVFASVLAARHERRRRRKGLVHGREGADRVYLGFHCRTLVHHGAAQNQGRRRACLANELAGPACTLGHRSLTFSAKEEVTRRLTASNGGERKTR